MSAILVTPRKVVFGRTTNLNKFNAKPTEVDGIRFPSKKQAIRYQALKLLERNGEVRALRLEVEYRLAIRGHLICKYRADFVYEECRRSKWAEVVEDVKGYRTPAYRLKKKLMLAIHGIEVRET